MESSLEKRAEDTLKCLKKYGHTKPGTNADEYPELGRELAIEAAGVIEKLLIEIDNLEMYAADQRQNDV